jgi:group I intron endonuclease
MSSVYLITNLINGKQYVGKTDLTSEHRWKQHLNYSGNDRHLTHALRKYGKESFRFEEIKSDLTAADAAAIEIKIIEALGTFENGYNKTRGGEGSSGYKLNQDQLKRMSESQRKRWSDPEERKKQSIRKTGCPSWNKGKKRSAAERAKQSANSSQRKKTHCRNGHPYSGDNLYMWNNHRICVTCRNIHNKTHYWRHKAGSVDN